VNIYKLTIEETVENRESKSWLQAVLTGQVSSLCKTPSETWRKLPSQAMPRAS
jgi:hypothetical protein